VHVQAAHHSKKAAFAFSWKKGEEAAHARLVLLPTSLLSLHMKQDMRAHSCSRLQEQEQEQEGEGQPGSTQSHSMHHSLCNPSLQLGAGC
jgi:hypothetical protein